MLDWSLITLARAAGLSVVAVKRLEDGVTEASQNEVTNALASAGVVFLSDDGKGPGIRLSPDATDRPSSS